MTRTFTFLTKVFLSIGLSVTCFNSNLFSQATITERIFTTGAASFTVPASVTISSLQVQAWGGGGGGSGVLYVTGSGVSGSGGGGGAYATRTYTGVGAGAYPYFVGAGGAGGVGGNGSPGRRTTFQIGSDFVVADSGRAGTTGPNAGGLGGRASSCIPTVGAFNGGNGATGVNGNGSTNGGGGGGGGAGSSGAGSNGIVSSGTSGGAGGSTGGSNGGNGRFSGTVGGGTGGGSTSGTAATNPSGSFLFAGAGGGGSWRNNFGTTDGGRGANGMIWFTYEMPAPTVTAAAPLIFCENGTNITITGSGFRTFTDNPYVTSVTINGFTATVVSSTYSSLVVTAPAGVNVVNSIVVTTPAGTASFTAVPITGNTGPICVGSNLPLTAVGLTSPTLKSYTLTVTGTFTAPLTGNIEVLVVAGGGGGGGNFGGGGGGGGVVSNAAFPVVLNTVYNYSVGAGGSGGSSTVNGSDGENSTFGSITAIGGGGGGRGGQPGRNGGSGGGGSQGQIGGTGTFGQGNNGGNQGGGNYGAGGGGAGGAGANASNGAGSTGGVGVTSSITGTSLTYGGGGGGGNGAGSTQYGGGVGGGGQGGNNNVLSVTGTAGLANRGGGGGGGGRSGIVAGSGGSGGSGVIYLRYPRLYWESSNTGVATVSQSGVVTGVSEGTATITYYQNGLNGSSTCITSVSTVVTVRPTPTATISGTATVCQNSGNQTITFTNPQNLPVTVTYSPPGGGSSTINVPASSTATVSQATSSAGTFTYNLVSVAYQDGNPGCSNGISGTATVTVNALPTSSGVSFTANPICAGTTTTVNANAAAGSGTISSYLWSAGVTPNNAASGSVNTAGSYSITVTNSNGCSLVATSPTLVVNARPTAVISGNVTICNGQSTNLSIAVTGVAPWSGTLSDGTVFSGSSSPITVSVSPSTNTTYTVASLTDANCSAQSLDLSGSAVVSIDNNCPITWDGSDGTAWNNAANWTPPVIPNGCGFNVTIPAITNQPQIDNATFTVGELNMDEDAFVLFTNTNGRLNVCKNINAGSGNGSSLIGSGRAVLNGSSPQTLSGVLNVDILRLDNTTGAGIGSGEVNVGGYLELQNGNFVTNNRLTFKSPNEQSCAMLDNFSPGFSGTLTGTVFAERGYAAASAPSLHKQHFFSSPVQNMAITQFAPAKGINGVPVKPTPDCDERYTASGGNYGNVFEYNEALVTACHLEGWVVRSSGQAQTIKGYSVVKNGSGVLSVNGLPHFGNYSLPGLTNSGWISGPTPQNNTYTSGWSLVGNPYLASLDLDYNVNGDFDDVIQLFHTNGIYEGTFQPQTMSSSDVVAPFQGFFVHKSLQGGTATFNINAANRSRTTTTFQKNLAHQMSLQVMGNGFADITYFNFDANATDSWDALYDGGKLPSFIGQPTLYSIIGAEWASINTNPSVETSPSIPVGFVPGMDGSYIFQGTGFDQIPNTTVYLEDKKENIMHNLTAIADYNFSSNKNDARERFVLHFNYEAPSSIASMAKLTPTIHLFPNPSSGNVTLILSANHGYTQMSIWDATGKMLQSANIDSIELNKVIDLSSFAVGVYSVRLSGNNSTSITKLIKQ